MTRRERGRRSVRPTLARGDYRESLRVTAILRRESSGGVLLLIATLAALIAANSPWAEGYAALRETVVGVTWGGLHLDLSLAAWTADGLLAVFFLLVGLELKREFVAGDLKDPGTALVPIVAAAGGVAVPALIYTAVTWGEGGLALAGWAIPSATDIAFALAVLAVVGTHLPAAMRTFLMTLAVVDDLIAILIIAVFYASDLRPLWLLAALLPLGLFALVTRARAFLLRHAWSWVVLLAPLALATWVCVHESGVHATIAGVLLGVAFPIDPAGAGGARTVADLAEHRLRPLSTAIAVPVFAFFAAGVRLGDPTQMGRVLTGPVALGIMAGLVIGKTVGISGATWLVTRLRGASLDPDLRWLDVIGLSVLGGVGFTVSLLVGELAFGHSAYGEQATLGVLTGSVIAALAATLVLGARNRYYRRLEAEEALDSDADGVPDRFQSRPRTD